MALSDESAHLDELAALRTALRGQYSVERELGRGGMGIVVLGRDERLDRQVALKVLPPALADIAETRERFLREARMTTAELDSALAAVEASIRAFGIFGSEPEQMLRLRPFDSTQ